MRTPSAGPCSAKSESSSPALSGQSSLAADHVHLGWADVARRARLPRSEARRGAGTRRAGGRAGRRRPRAPRFASDRAPAPRRARARDRWRPSRRDGARCASPAASAARTASGDAESKSPTAIVTSSPDARACSSPLSAAMTGVPAGTHERALRIGRLPAGDDHHDSPTRLPPLALPRSGSAGRRRVQPPSQPGCPSSPYVAAIVARSCAIRGRPGG